MTSPRVNTATYLSSNCERRTDLGRYKVPLGKLALLIISHNLKPTACNNSSLSSIFLLICTTPLCFYFFKEDYFGEEKMSSIQATLEFDNTERLRLEMNATAWKNCNGYQTSSGCPCWDKSPYCFIPKSSTGFGYTVNCWAILCCCYCDERKDGVNIQWRMC